MKANVMKDQGVSFLDVAWKNLVVNGPLQTSSEYVSSQRNRVVILLDRLASPQQRTSGGGSSAGEPRLVYFSQKPLGNGNSDHQFTQIIDRFLSINMERQECIPVGCVPTSAVAATRCQYGGLELGRPPLEADPPPTVTDVVDTAASRIYSDIFQATIK